MEAVTKLKLIDKTRKESLSRGPLKAMFLTREVFFFFFSFFGRMSNMMVLFIITVGHRDGNEDKIEM